MSEADENPYMDLSDDNDLAFLQLESEFREELENEMEDQNSHFDYHARNYMNRVVAAAKALEIEIISEFGVPNHSDNHFHDSFSQFQMEVDNLIVQLRIHHARRNKRLSVGFTADQKTKLIALVQRMREDIECSNASEDKKFKLQGILGELEKEISRDRTRFEYFGDLARGLASISREVEEEGARPWWKWFAAIMGIVDAQKETEPKQLPRIERKRLEPPQKRIADQRSGKIEGLDDEIPF